MQGVTSGADCILTASDEDLAQIMTGKMDATNAFVSGKLKVSFPFLSIQQIHSFICIQLFFFVVSSHILNCRSLET
jgi:putative sterol carrier protein